MLALPVLLLAAALAAVVPAGAAAGATVVRVIDGDTVDVRAGGKLRTVHLAGVDAPERAACGGAEATRALARLLPRGARVRLQGDPAAAAGARYVFRGGRLINGTLLGNGSARTGETGALRKRSALLAAEAEAQRERRGLWTACAAPPPAAAPTPAPAAGETGAPDPAQRVRAELADRLFIKKTGTSIWESSERRLHLCQDGYADEEVSWVNHGNNGSRRTEGSWEVVSADSSGARVRLFNQDGETFRTFVTQGQRVTIDGVDMTEVAASDVCAIRRAGGSTVVARTAGARPKPKQEYTPPSKRACRQGYELLEETRFQPPRVRCVPRRTSRLWYRARLDVKYDGQRVNGIVKTDTKHKWSFTSDHAAVLYRQCSALALEGTDDHKHDEAALGVPDNAARMPCARVGRALGAELLEDVSFGYRGVIVGGSFSDRTEWTESRPMQWDVYGPNGSIHKEVVPCTRTFVDEVLGTGPTRWPGVLSTIGQSARTGGVTVGGDAAPHVAGPGTLTKNAASCPAPAGAVAPLGGTRAASSEPVFIDQLSGSGLADLFTPSLASQFGKPVITASNTVRRVTGPVTANATFTLTLTRCPDGGRRAEGC